MRHHGKADPALCAFAWRQRGRRTLCVADAHQRIADNAGRHRLAAERGVAGAHRIAQAQLAGIDAERRCEIVDLRLARERCLRIAETAERARAQLVRVDDRAMRADIRNSIRAARHQEGERQHGGAFVGVRAAVERHAHVAREYRAIAPRAGLHPDPSGVSRTLHLEVLHPRQHEFHRAACGARQPRGDRVQVRRVLAAECAADASCDHPNPRHRLAELLGDALLHVVHRLAARIQRDAAARVDVRDAAIRFEVDVMLRLRLERSLDDRIALRECVVDVALGNVGFEDDVAVSAAVDGLDVGGEAFVDERCVACECRIGRQHAAQWFVVDLDRGGRADRRRGVDGRDGRDRLADIADLVTREHRLVLDDAAPARTGDIGTGDDRVHAGQRARGVGPAGNDACVCVLAGMNRGVEHAGQANVVGVTSPARCLVGSVQPWRTPARGGVRIPHGATPARRSAASTIFT